MEIFIIALLLLLGILFILAEIFLIPGITIAALIGGACFVGAIVATYLWMGVTAGHIMLISLGILTFIGTIFFLRSKTWKSFGLNAAIDSKMNEEYKTVHEGDLGFTVGRLSPMGKVRIGEIEYEAESIDGYVDPNAQVKVIKVMTTKLVVTSSNEI